MGSCRRFLSSGGPSQSWGHVSGFLMGSDKGWVLARAVGLGGHPLDILLFYRSGVELRGFVSRLPGVGKTRGRSWTQGREIGFRVQQTLKMVLVRQLGRGLQIDG